MENWGHTVWMNYRHKTLKFARKHWGNGLYEFAFQLLHTNHTLGKRGPHSLNGLQAKSPEICTKPPRQWVLWGPSSIITHKISPWKTGAIQFEWITSKKIQNLHETTKAMGFMRSLFHYYTQITPLENGGHEVWMNYKQPTPKFARNHWGIGFYEVPFPLLHTNHPPWKTGATQFEWIISKNSEIRTKPLRQWVLWGCFSIITHKSPPWKTEATQF